MVICFLNYLIIWEKGIITKSVNVVVMIWSCNKRKRMTVFQRGAEHPKIMKNFKTSLLHNTLCGVIQPSQPLQTSAFRIPPVLLRWRIHSLRMERTFTKGKREIFIFFWLFFLLLSFIIPWNTWHCSFSWPRRYLRQSVRSPS